MKTTSARFKKLIALLLILSILLSSVQFLLTVQAEELPLGDSLHGWQVSCFWGNGSRDYAIDSSRSETIAIKLTVEYYAPLSVMTRDFAPGSVSFSVPDIGGVRRSGAAYEPDTASDSLDSDWLCAYDIATKSYVFTNKNTFQANIPLSGGFELKWTVSTRECIDGYSLSSNPVFTLEGDSIRMPEVSFSCHTDRDYYRLSLAKEYLDYNETFSNDIRNEDYITYVYRTYFSVYQRARGGDLNRYFVKIEIDDDLPDEDYEQIIVRYDNANYFLQKVQDPYSASQVWGFYRFFDYPEEQLSTDKFTVSYPRSMDGKNATITTFLEVQYLDEPDGNYVTYESDLHPNETLTASITAPIKFYSYTYGGGRFDVRKKSSYESYAHQIDKTYSGLEPAYADKYLSKNIYSGETVRFSLEGVYTLQTSAGSRSSVVCTTSSSAGVDLTDEDADLSTRFDMVLGDDRLYVEKNSQTIRPVESDEYTIAGLVMPANKGDYSYDIYVSDVGYRSEAPTVAQNRSGRNDYKLYASGNTSTQRSFRFDTISQTEGFESYTDGVKAVYVVIHEVYLSLNYAVSVDIQFHFDIDREMALPLGQQINSEGFITNEGYMRVFKTTGGGSLCRAGASHYDYSHQQGTGIEFDSPEYKSFDMLLDSIAYTDNYNASDLTQNELLLHAWSSVYLRDMMSSISSMTDITSDLRNKEDGAGYDIGITSQGTIISDVYSDSGIVGELSAFSLYVRMPSVLIFDEQLNKLELKNCYAKDSTGRQLLTADFRDHVTLRLIVTPSGDRVIAADFDFSDSPLDISYLVNVRLEIPAVFSYADYKEMEIKTFLVQSYIMIQDKGIQKVIAKTTPTTDEEDFNENGLTSEVMASSEKSTTYEKILEWKDTAEKYVRSSTDDGWSLVYDDVNDLLRSETTVNAASSLLDAQANKRAEYDYKLNFDVGSNSSDFVFADVLENEPASQWHGQVIGLDFSHAKSLGLIPSVYYDTTERVYTETITNPDAGQFTSNIGDFTPARAEEWAGDYWIPPVNNIRSLVVRLDAANLPNGVISDVQVSFIIHMRAPEDVDDSLYETRAVNTHTVYYTGHNIMFDQRKDEESFETLVLLKEPTLTLTLKKVDKETGKPLAGAVFSFYRDSKCRFPLVENVEVSAIGEIFLDSLKPGTYYFKEVSVPIGYRLDPTLHRIDLIGSDQSYQTNASLILENERLKGTLIFTKKDADNAAVTGLAGAEYSLYDAGGINVFTDENNVYQESGGTKSIFTTDANGKIEITGLPWGVYYLAEITPPPGYELNPEQVWFVISKNINVDEQQTQNDIIVYQEQTDEEKTASLKLIKYDQDGVTTLPNAWFVLEKQEEDGTWQEVSSAGMLKTSPGGFIIAEGLKFGTYRFREINPPTGYEIDPLSPVTAPVTLNASTAETVQTMTKTNPRILGSATLRKVSDNGTPVNGAKFDLYMVIGEIDYLDGVAPDDPQDSLIRTGLTTATRSGQAGMLETVEGLEWGTYYFRETFAPLGYERNDTIYVFTISAENASTTVDDCRPVNYRKKGEVLLYKTAGEAVDAGLNHYDRGDPVPGAVFALYNAVNERLWVLPDDPDTPTQYRVCSSETTGAVSQMVTDAAGQLYITGLDWGLYSLEEIAAPPGFAPAERVRFTINSVSCLSLQELSCENFAGKCLLTIDKAIDARLDVFGTPTFLFKVQKLDLSDQPEEEYLVPIILSGQELTGSASLSISPGKYRVSEIKVARYTLSDQSYVTEDGATTVPAGRRTITPEHTFEFTITGDGGTFEQAEVLFSNTLEDYSGLSHNSAALNLVPSKKKMTGFSLEMKNQIIPCADTQNASYPITTADLTAVILYDDGSTEEMTPEQLARITPGSWTVDNGYANEGVSFLENAVYTDETGRTWRADFIVTVDAYHAVEAQKVTFLSDEDNACVFVIGTRRTVSHVVYYGEVEGVRQAISGSYVVPEIIAGHRQLQNWKIVGGDAAGTLLHPTEEAVKQYLTAHYDEGLRELKLQAVLAEDVYEFYPDDDEQELTVPKEGLYFIEGWGGRGGNVVVGGEVKARGGEGGYSYAWVYLKEGDTIHVTVGTNGSDAAELNQTVEGGYNGGASGTSSGDTYYAAGGGATHFALTVVGEGLLSDYAAEEDRQQVLLVAGGGGGGAYYDTERNGGNGGGETGGPGSGPDYFDHGFGSGGTQTQGGAGYENTGTFGCGGTSATSCTSGGGGGWYGGGGASGGTSAGGGSGYVNEERVAIGETIGGNDPDRPNNDGHATVTYLEDEIDLPDSPELHKFTAPVSGYYLLEAWGAAGGSSLKDSAVVSAVGGYANEDIQEGGRGGYACGTIYLEAGESLYYSVGKRGANHYLNQSSSPTINLGENTGGSGGGGAQTPLTDGIWNGGSGGGATCFLLNVVDTGALSGYASQKGQILLVAGGGGGSGYYVGPGGSYGSGIGGCGGGAQAQSGQIVSQNELASAVSGTGGTQSAGGSGVSDGSFGQGGQGTAGTTGGGGGLYGGGSALASGGGSGCANTQYLLQTRNVNGIYEGSYFDSTGQEIIPEYIPTFAGAIVDNGIVGSTSTDTQMYGNRGDGFARITHIPRVQVVDYAYSGYPQSFTASVDGYYKLEAWGAQGGSVARNQNPDNPSRVMAPQEGGKGGYSYGTVYLQAGQTIYVTVGGTGQESYRSNGGYPFVSGGYNGGGMAISDNNKNRSASGGGATHFALTMKGNGVLADYVETQDSVLLVAGGGGGAYSSSQIQYYSMGGAGGGETGGEAFVYHTRSSSLSSNSGFVYEQGMTIPGGGQEEVENDGYYVYGTFGKGTSADWNNDMRGRQWTGTDAGAGGGWYGGARLCNFNAGGMAGGGGSGHCSDTHLTASFGYDTICGTEEFLAPDGTAELGHSGNGYARVTLVSEEPNTAAPISADPNVYDFDYTGAAQVFTAPETGVYRFEAWGASGGDAVTMKGGRGAYTSGNIFLNAGETIYVYVGGAGKAAYNELTPELIGAVERPAGGYNGAVASRNNGSGGGATDFRLVGGEASSFDSLKSRIMVAAAGGGAHWYRDTNYSDLGGAGGALTSDHVDRHFFDVDATTYCYGATQTSGGYCLHNGTPINVGGFGVCNEPNHAGGRFSSAGSGYYAGGGARQFFASSGGSSFISGYAGCDAIDEASTSNNIIHTGQPVHYSGKSFTDTLMLSGLEKVPTHDGFGTATGNTGNGFARITFLRRASEWEDTSSDYTTTFHYSGKVQAFTAPMDGTYKLEAWGASGGDAYGVLGGRGAYTSGEIHLSAGETIYVYVGSAGTGYRYKAVNLHNAGGFNGGGNALSNTGDFSKNRWFASGGGATDFRLVPSEAEDGWSGFDSLKSRIMVAAGGGGSMQHETYYKSAPGGYGGALQGGTGVTNNGTTYTNDASGGTQTSGGYCLFDQINCGVGQFGYATDNDTSDGGHTGGGSGYYAGGSSRHTSASGGGSSFVSGYPGCNAIDASSTEDAIVHTGQPNHYSGKIFSNPVMRRGNQTMPDHDGTENVVGNSGNGFAKITLIG